MDATPEGELRTIAQTAVFFRRLAVLVVIGAVLVAGAFLFRERMEHHAAHDSAVEACVEGAWQTGDPDKFKAAIEDGC